MRYEIIVDDDDRADAPDKPWTATCTDPEISESGIGATPHEALADLAATWAREAP